MARLELTVSPGAARSELIGRHGTGWRARVAALGIRVDQVAVVAGRSGRRKVVEIECLTAAEIERRLEAALAAG